jgi:hypothetical protein
MTRPTRAIGAISLAAMLLVGCSQPNKPVPVSLNKNEQAIINVGLAYRDASHALMRGPAGEKDLKPYLKKYGDPDQVLISPHDGQPYQITWGLMPSQRTKSAFGHRFLVYEKTGQHGKRYAVDIMLKVHHLNAEEFAKAQGPN